VKEGQILLELDPALIKASIAQIDATLRSAEASQRLAESSLKRNQELVRKGFISDATLEQNTRDLDVAKANVSQIKSQLDRERTNLSYTVIRSPINGIVIDRKIDVGQTVAASFSTPTLFQIAQSLDAMQIDTSIAEADVGTVKSGMPVKFTVDAYPDREFVGAIRLVRLNATINQGVVTYNVIVDTTNENQLLKPGMTAQVSFVAAQADGVTRIPTAALRFKPPKDDKEDKKKKDAKAAEKKTDGKTDAKAEAKVETQATNADGIAKGDGRQLAGPGAGGAGGSGASGGGRRGVGTVYKLNDKNELVPVQVRTGIASNQHTELLSGDVKPGDELVIRDLQDKTKK
jgi:HlyD family secretion protein